MTPDQLYKEARAVKESGARCGVTLVIPKEFKPPPGFPRGELLCETERGKCRSYNPDKILAWLEKNNLLSEENTSE